MEIFRTKITCFVSNKFCKWVNSTKEKEYFEVLKEISPAEVAEVDTALRAAIIEFDHFPSEEELNKVESFFKQRGWL